MSEKLNFNDFENISQAVNHENEFVVEEGISTGENISESNENYITSIEVKNLSFEEEKNIVENMSVEDREACEEITTENEKIMNMALSDNPIEARPSLYGVLGSAFSNAPSSKKELEEMPGKNKLISNKFKILAAAILFSSMPLLSEAQHKQDKNEILTENVFDESTEKMAKQIFGWHKKERELYVALETKRKILYQQLENINEISPQTESEKSYYKMLETERDSKLAQVELRKAKFNKELMNSDLNDLKVLAEAEAKTKEFEYQRAVIIDDFEKKAEKFFTKKSADEIRAIQSEIKKITLQIDKMINYRIRNINRTSAFTFY